MNDPFAAPGVTDVAEQEDVKQQEERMAKWLFTVLLACALGAVYYLWWPVQGSDLVFSDPGYYISTDDEGRTVYILHDGRVLDEDGRVVEHAE